METHRVQSNRTDQRERRGKKKKAVIPNRHMPEAFVLAHNDNVVTARFVVLTGGSKGRMATRG